LITVHIMGGLGNQMFQYAAARSLAHRLRTGLRLDVSEYFRAQPSTGASADHPRALDLVHFDLAEHDAVHGWRALPLRAIFTLAERIPPRIAQGLFGVYRDPGSDCHSLANARSGVYLHGYFQSERYFANAAAVIRQEFRLRDRGLAAHVEGNVRAMRRNDRPLVSIHVRRGDYLLVNPGGRLLVPIEKIQHAMARFDGADFLVFSDDLAWCRERLAGPSVRYSPFDTAIEDFMAMSLCDHNIIANSTFSWWAAWLNENPRKQVLAPANWGAPADDEEDRPGRTPLGWLKI
jgi:hypothetical protein